MPAFSTEGLGSESIAAAYPFVWSLVHTIFGTLFALYSRDEKDGWSQGIHNTEEGMLLQYCSLHARLFSWKTTNERFPRAKINQIRGYSHFSVLPSPTLPTSKSSRVRVIDVQRPSDRYYASPPHYLLYDIETSNVLLFPL